MIRLLLIAFMFAGPVSIHLEAQKVQAGSMLSIGIMADCQYADQDPRGDRIYRKSPEKLEACIDTFNRLELASVFHLGDFIDLGHENFLKVDQISKKLIAPLHHVLGNHDFSVADSLKEDVHALMHMPSRYHVLDIRGWRFVVLDGNDQSMYAYAPDHPKHISSEALHRTQYANKPTWNGAIGVEQLTWLDQILTEADQEMVPVVLLCHFPVYPADVHNLWNAEEVVTLLERHPSVKAWLNGHNHAGNYGLKDGIHFVTFKGMVDTETNSFAKLTINHEQIIIRGFGRETDRLLILRDE